MEHNIWGVEILEKNTVKAGTILSKDDFSITIATIDYDIVLHIDLYDKLLECCRTNNIDQAKLLLNKNINIEERTKEGWTPLMIAVYNNATAIVELLITEPM